MNTSKPLFVDIDIAKASLELAVSDDARTHTFANTQEGLRDLLQTLSGKTVALVVLEATGGYEQSCALALAGAERVK